MRRQPFSSSWGLVLLGIFAGASARAVDINYWVEPCTRAATSCKKEDPQLAEWAMAAWQKSSDGNLHVHRTTSMEEAQIRIHWATAADGQYGEARPFFDGLIRGVNVYVRPDVTAMGPDISSTAKKDGLLRETIVYLTCLHETGHALGLEHTAEFRDIMYSFQFGGDIPEYFGRYRRLLRERSDIADHSGMSLADQNRLRVLLKQ